MSTRKETDRAKHIQEKCNLLLAEMLRDEDNKYCVDCDAKGPRWASWNLGIFLCIRCAGIHRNLGVHISKVKSVNLDAWTPVQVVSLQQMGNSRARAVYESYLPDGFRRPQTDSALESFIRAKYEHKKYLAREWVQPPLPKVDWDKEIDEELERQKKKKKSGAVVSGTIGSLTTQVGALTKTPPAAAKTIASLPAPIAKPKPSSPKAVRSDNLDLLGLASPTKGANDDLDMFSGFLSAAPAPAPADTLQPPAKVATTDKEPSVPTPAPAAGNFSSLAQEVDFFNHVPNGNKGSGATAGGKMTKDSIMALYGQTPVGGTGPASLGNYGHQPPHQPQPPQFGQQPASLPQPNLYQFGGAPQHQMFGMPQQQQPQQQQQQNGLLFQLGGATNSNMLPPHTFNQQFGQFAGAQMLPQMPAQHTANQTSTINLINKINTMPSAGADLSKHFGNINLGNVWP